MENKEKEYAEIMKQIAEGQKKVEKAKELDAQGRREINAAAYKMNQLGFNV